MTIFIFNDKINSLIKGELPMKEEKKLQFYLVLEKRLGDHVIIDCNNLTNHRKLIFCFSLWTRLF